MAKALGCAGKPKWPVAEVNKGKKAAAEWAGKGLQGV
jgi:hypothetical protein